MDEQQDEQQKVRQLLKDIRTISIQIAKLFNEHNTGQLESAIAMLTILAFLKDTEPRTYAAAVLIDECLEASRHSRAEARAEAGDKTLSQEDQTRIAKQVDASLERILGKHKLGKHKNDTGDKD